MSNILSDVVIKNFFAILMLFFVLGGAHAFAYPQSVGARGESFGKAYRAVCSANDIVLYNPAGIINKRRIGADVDYLMTTNARLHSLSVSVVDSQTTAWGMGVLYNAGISLQSMRATTHLAYVALAMPLGTDQITIGTGFSYLFDPLDERFSYKHFFNMDAGLLVDLGSGLRFAAVADHLLSKKGSEKSMGLSVGSAFFLSELIPSLPITLSFDWSMTDVKSESDLGHVLGVGFEYLVFTVVPLRIGYNNIVLQNRMLSLGTGLIAEGLAFDVFYQQDLAVGKNRQFGFAARVNF